MSIRKQGARPGDAGNQGTENHLEKSAVDKEALWLEPSPGEAISLGSSFGTFADMDQNRKKRPLAEVVNLVKDFAVTSASGRKAMLHAVSDVSLPIYKGETLALVGESGCGKSTLGRCLLRLTDVSSGQIWFDGTNITTMQEKKLFQFRRRMQIVFQDPYASINPRMTVAKIIEEPLKTHKIYPTKQEMHQRVLELCNEVGIRTEYLNRYPHQFSGGQRQRIGIARALALMPDLIVCDEPVSALDVSIQSQILNLLHELQEKYGLTYLFISHDLSVVRYLSDRVCVMFLGSICEIGDTEEVFARPMHPYTRFLIQAVPHPDPHLRGEERELLQGEIPSPVNPPSGCRFHTRCPYAMETCLRQVPKMREMKGRQVACHYPLEDK